MNDSESAARKVTKRPPIDDVFLLELGRITAYFAFLEAIMEISIWTLMFGDKFQEWRMGGAATRLMPFGRQVELFHALALFRFGDSEKLSKLVARIREINTTRNTVVHALWYGSVPDKPAMRVRLKSVRDQLQFTSATSNLEELRAVASEVNTIADDLSEFMGPIRMPEPTPQ